MHRFHVPPGSVDGAAVRLPDAAARQVAQVLRMRPGDVIAVFDGSGLEWTVELTDLGRGGVSGRVTATARPCTEPAARVTLWQGLLDQAQFELVLQKGTELGVAAFVPLLCERVQGSRSGGPSARRQERWRRIIREAAEQCGRVVLPRLGELARLDALELPPGGPTFVLWEEETGLSLRAALASRAGEVPGAVSLIVGPKGGFTAREVETLRARGAVPVSLGPRVLRGETAALAAVTAVLYELGDMAPRA